MCIDDCLDFKLLGIADNLDNMTGCVENNKKLFLI